MGDPIWLDTMTMIRASSGDKAMEGEIAEMRKDGHPLLICPKVNEELFLGNTVSTKAGQPMTMVDPVSRGRRQYLMGRYDIRVDMEGGRVPVAERRAVLMKALNNLSA